MPSEPSNQAWRHATRSALTTACAALVALAAAPLAQARTVQKCMIDGHIVFQASACPAAPTALAVAAPAPAEAASVPKKKTLADLLRERDGNDHPAPPAREFQRDGANVLRARMGAV